MAKRSDIDKAVGNLMQWTERPEWADDYSDIFHAHLGPLCERLGISDQELAEETADYGHMLLGVIFEDLASRRLPPDDRNLVDDYLKRRGWRESVPGRRYLQQVRDSVLSLYVVDVSPGQHCDVRDQVRWCLLATPWNGPKRVSGFY